MHKSISEIEALPSGELTEWIAWFSLKNKEAEAKRDEEEKAKNEAILRNSYKVKGT